MKKEDFLSLFVYLIMIASAIILSTTVLNGVYSRYIAGSFITEAQIWFAILFVFCGILLSAILIEVGHVVGAQLGGYVVYSVNVLFFNFYKEDEKWKFRFKNFDGLTGETKILADEKNETKKKYLNLYCLFPLMFYSLIVIIFIILTICYSYQPSNTLNIHLGNSCAAFLFFVVTGGIISFYDIFPAKLDCLNDGYILTIINRKENLEVYNEYLKIKFANESGNKIGNYKVFERITDFSAEINLYAIYDLLRQKKYDEAEKIIDLNLENIKEISKSTYYKSLSHKIFILLSTKPVEECKAFFEENIISDYRHFLNKSSSSETVRAYLLVSGLIEESESETRNALNVREKAIKKFSPLWKDIENDLYEVCLNKIDEKHPEWKIKEKPIE